MRFEKKEKNGYPAKYVTPGVQPKKGSRASCARPKNGTAASTIKIIVGGKGKLLPCTYSSLQSTAVYVYHVGFYSEHHFGEIQRG